MARPWMLLTHRLSGQRTRELGVLLGLSVVIGVIAGVGAIAFHVLLDASKHFFLDGLAGFRPGGPEGELSAFTATSTPFRRWVLLLLPAVGGLASGILVQWLAPEAEGHGTDAAIDAYHHRRGKLRVRVPFVKAITSALTIGTGGSAGREGPIAQIGAGLASGVAQWLKLPRKDRAVLMAAGMGAGIGAIFHAPLAGAIFSAEVMYRELDIEHEVLWPAFISSIVGYSVAAVKLGWAPLFVTPDFTFEDPVQLLPYTVLAIVVAAGAALFVRTFYFVHAVSKRVALPAWSKPAIGGLLVGAIGWFLPDTLATGYGILQEGFRLDAAAPALSVGAFLLLALGRMATTSFSIATGGSGGVFGPSIVIGGCLGGAVGLVAARVFTGTDIQPGAFVMMGMAGFFAAAGHTPLSTIIMVGEMTGNYELLAPSMLVCMVAYLLVGQRSIFENQLPSRLDAPSKHGHMMSAVLRRMTVHDALAGRARSEVPIVAGATPLTVLLDRIAESGHECYPVVDRDGRLTGVVDARTIRYVLRDSEAHELLLAVDLATPPVTLVPTDSLHEAIGKMVSANREELVVVDADDPAQVIGTLGQSDVVAAYDRELSASRRE